MNKYMKLNRIVLIGALTALPIWATAQSVTKPRIQTSAAPEETAVFTSGKKNTEKKNDQPAAKEEARASEKRQKKEKAPKAERTITDRYMALKTNIAYDAVAVLNLDYEIQVHPRMTVDIPVMWSLWDAQREHALRIVALQPELRWWMGSETGRGHFFGLHAHAAWFNVKWDDTRYQDTGRPLMGAGLSYGYKLPLGEHWGAEFTIGFGYANMKYDTYYNIENGAWLDTRKRNYWGPTKIGLTLVYKL